MYNNNKQDSEKLTWILLINTLVINTKLVRNRIIINQNYIKTKTKIQKKTLNCIGKCTTMINKKKCKSLNIK